MECYCKEDLPNRINEVFQLNYSDAVEEKKLCQLWLQKDLFTNLLPFIIVIVIVSLNMTMQTLFKGIS